MGLDGAELPYPGSSVVANEDRSHSFHLEKKDRDPDHHNSKDAIDDGHVLCGAKVIAMRAQMMSTVQPPPMLIVKCLMCDQGNI